GRKIMPRLRVHFRRLVGFLRKKNCDAEMAEEMQQHVDGLTERNIARGMPPHEARQAALREFGGIEQIKEIAREKRVWVWPDSFGKMRVSLCECCGEAPGFHFSPFFA